MERERGSEDWPTEDTENTEADSEWWPAKDAKGREKGEVRMDEWPTECADAWGEREVGGGRKKK